MEKVLTFVVLCLCAVFISADKVELSPRISGGAAAHTQQFPFAVSVHHAGSFICGGVLISSSWVLTSAECVYPYQNELPLFVYIAVGGLLHTGLEPGKYDVPLDVIRMHPDFNYAAAPEYLYKNNVALLHLTVPAPISSTIAPITLPLASEIISTGDQVWYIGWGGKTENVPSDTLQYVNNAHIMDWDECSAYAGNLLDMTHVCIQPTAINAACKFDHGSPLFRIDPNYGFVLLGIVNYAPCLTSDHPTVFASVPAQRWWISTVTGL